MSDSKHHQLGRSVLGHVPATVTSLRRRIAKPVDPDSQSVLGRELPKVEQMMRDARDDLLAFAAFPQQHWRKIWSINPLERSIGSETAHQGRPRLS
jgi:hypothetical protein